MLVQQQLHTSSGLTPPTRTYTHFPTHAQHDYTKPLQPKNFVPDALLDTSGLPHVARSREDKAVKMHAQVAEFNGRQSVKGRMASHPAPS